MAELYGLEDVARLAGVTVGSMRVYHARATAARRAGTPVDEIKPGSAEAFPAPTHRVGQTPIWTWADLQPWLQARTTTTEGDETS